VEYKLSQMERGKLKRDLFMREISSMTSKIVDRPRAISRTPCRSRTGDAEDALPEM